MKPTHRLSAMMFFQYAIFGAWHPVISKYLLTELKFDGQQVGVVFALISLASLSSSWIVGYLADRHFSAQKIMGILHLLAGCVILVVAQQKEFGPFVILMGLYCFIFIPTISLNNSIVFTHITHREKEFSRIRVWGTIGWIIVALLLAGWRHLATIFSGLDIKTDLMLLSAGLSFIGSIIAFRLPHTPPAPKHEHMHYRVAIKEMITNRNIRFVLLAVFMIATLVMFYYVFSAPLLTSPEVGLSDVYVSPFLSMGQLVEILAMAILLPILLPKLGFKKIFVMGLIAWVIRYLFMATFRTPLILALPVLLHGICYVFIYTNTSIFIDHNVSPKIRSTAHSLLNVVISGLGNLIGSLGAGWAQTHWTKEGFTDWQTVFMIPAMVLIAPILMLVFGFKKKRKKLIVNHN